MCTEQRKVKYSLNPKEGFYPDLSDQEWKEREDQECERIGIFHGFFQQPQDDTNSIIAIVEDEETGETHHVPDNLIRFVKEEDDNKMKQS